MPTIDQLPPAFTVSDSDEVALWQSGNTVAATRAQMLAGVQPSIALSAGMLVGRNSAGIGGVEPITVGANLSLSGGILSAPAPFGIASLPTGTPPGPHDSVPLLQNGEQVAVSYASFASSLCTIPGLDLTLDVVAVQGGIGTRTLSSLFADALSIESFGAVGDGETDDTAAFCAALSSGTAIRLGAKTYVVNGTLEATEFLAIFGLPGLSFVRRNVVPGAGNWVTANCASCLLYGVVFDAGSLPLSAGPAVSVTSACVDARISHCSFINANAGHGLAIEGNALAYYGIADSIFRNNVLNGLSLDGAGNLTVAACKACSNGQAGIAILGGANCAVTACAADGNCVGLSYGDATQGIDYASINGNLIIRDGSFSANSDWGISVYANSPIIVGNVVTSNGQIASGGAAMLRIWLGVVGGNTFGGLSLCVDARCSLSSSITDNIFQGTGTGIIVGGSQYLTIDGNKFLGIGSGVIVSAIEPAITYQSTNFITVVNNAITLGSVAGVGVCVLDGAEGVAVLSNRFYSNGLSQSSQALWVHSDTSTVAGNCWNNVTSEAVSVADFAGLPTLIFGDVTDDILVSGGLSSVQSFLTGHQADTLGQVSFIRVQAPGLGYTAADVQITGSGSGASATPVIVDGAILWIVLTNPGSGYGPISASQAVTIVGDGSGAAAVAFVGAPVISGRRLHITTTNALTIDTEDSMPVIQTWSATSLSLPAFGSAEVEGVFGNWCVTSSPPSSFVGNDGAGDVFLRSATGGGVTLRSSNGGRISVVSDVEPAGISSHFGRGSPECIVVANPGSDYRNLDGGADNTFWIKRDGADSKGWVALA